MIFNPRCGIRATISVTYNVGRVCTCTNGIVTHTAPNTSGTVTFTVNSKGNWTISDGLETRTVSITQNRQSVSVVMRRLYVLGAGATITGDGTYTHGLGDTFTWRVQVPGEPGDTGYTRWMAQTSTVNLTNYSTLGVEIDDLQAMRLVTDFGINVRPAIWEGYETPTFNLRDRAAGQTARFNISGFSGNQYIGFSTRNGREAHSFPVFTGRIFVV